MSLQFGGMEPGQSDVVTKGPKWSKESFEIIHSELVTEDGIARLDQFEQQLLQEGTVWSEEILREGLRLADVQDVTPRAAALNHTATGEQRKSATSNS